MTKQEQKPPNITARIPMKLKNDFKAKVSRQGKQMSEVLIELITKYLK